MNEIRKYVKAFYDQAFSKEIKQKIENNKIDFMNHSDRDVLSYCINKAWVDAVMYERMQPSYKDKSDNKGQIVGIIYKFFETVIAGKEVNYSKWHRDTCENSMYGMSVGLWQKLINMTFKYVYCVREHFSEISTFDFEQCHIPLDSYILDWFGFNDKKWNKIADYDEYITIQRCIKEALKKQDINSLLEGDFIVWEQSKAIKTANEIIKGLAYFVEDKERVKFLFREDIDMIHVLASELDND